MAEKVALLTAREIEDGRRERESSDAYEFWTYRPLEELSANPFQRADDPLTAVLHLEGIPAGRMHMIRDEIVLNGRTYPWIWVGSLHTQPAYRGRGVITHVFAAVIEHARQKGTIVGGAGVTAGGRAAYRKAGLKLWGLAPRQVLPMSVKAFFRTHLGANKIAGFASAIPDLVLATLRWGIQQSLHRAREGFALETRDEFRIDVEPLFESIGRYPRFSRNLAKMKWRWQRLYDRRAPPDRDYRLAFLHCRANGEIAGFFILRLILVDRPGGMPANGIRVATVLDWCVNHQVPGSRKALVSYTIEQAVELGAEALEFTTTDPWMQQVLRRRGFLHLGGYRLFYFAPEGTPLASKNPGDLSEFWWNGCDPEDPYTW